jgi:ankyrin repeat protein
MIQLLIDNGADPNAQTANDALTPLHLVAMGNGNADCARILIENGANIDDETENGWNPFKIAIHNGHERLVGLLLHVKSRAPNTLVVRDFSPR